MRLRCSIDGAIGTLVKDQGLPAKYTGCYLVDVGGRREVWRKDNCTPAPELDIAALSPEDAAELLRRLTDASA